MLLGQSPFRGEDEDEIFDAILEDEPLYPITMPRDAVSILQKVKDLLCSSTELLLSQIFIRSSSIVIRLVDLVPGRMMLMKLNDNLSSKM
jgi:hypothetical protein